MKKQRITDLVEAPGGGYWNAVISTEDGMTGTATIPDRGRVAVYKEVLEWPPRQTSFAWKIKGAILSSKSEKRHDHISPYPCPIHRNI